MINSGSRVDNFMVHFSLKPRLLISGFQVFSALLTGNLISHPPPLLTFAAIIQSFTPLTKSSVQSFNSPSSSFLLFHCLSCTSSFLLYPSFFLNLRFSSSPQLSFLPLLSACPSFPMLSLPVSLSVSCSISRPQEMVSFPIQGVGGVYSLSQTKRSLCESSKNTKKKRKADKNQKPTLIRLSRTNTHSHTLHLRCTHAKHFSNVHGKQNTFLYCIFPSRGTNTVSTVQGQGLAVELRLVPSCRRTHIGAHLREAEKRRKK